MYFKTRVLKINTRFTQILIIIQSFIIIIIIIIIQSQSNREIELSQLSANNLSGQKLEIIVKLYIIIFKDSPTKVLLIMAEAAAPRGIFVFYNIINDILINNK